MKALLAGDRRGTLLEVAILLAVIVGASVSVVLVLLYRGEAQHAQRGEYQLCVQRESYDQRNHALEQADAELMRKMIEANAFFPLDIRRLRNRAFHDKLAKDELYLAHPVVDGCELVKP